MSTVKKMLTTQYSLVVGARGVMLDFCAHINAEDLIRFTSNIGNGGSIRNLLVHICNTYYGWLSHFAFQRVFDKRAYQSVTNFEQCRQYFAEVDGIVATFLNEFENNYEQRLTGVSGDSIVTATPLQLFTHVITHEFHHKGQILALSRMWGYTPVDTDIIR